MIEKICSHCKATLLVGLQYCPGCLRPIEGRQMERFDQDTSEDYTENGKINPDTMFHDLKVAWSNFTYPLRAGVCRLFRRPEPADPPASPMAYRRDESRFAIRDSHAPSRISLSMGYTRIVCPRCQHAQRHPLDLSPSDVITCESCHAHFPGSFASEFRKGADLQCFRCGVTTFCVSGLKITSCPNCRARATVRAKTKLRPGVVATLTISLLVMGLVFAVLTRTTTQYLVWLSVTCIGSFVGFVTLCALGF